MYIKPYRYTRKILTIALMVLKVLLLILTIWRKYKSLLGFLDVFSCQRVHGLWTGDTVWTIQ